MKIKKIIYGFIKISLMIGGVTAIISYMKKRQKISDALASRMSEYFDITFQWLLNQMDGKKIEEYFHKNDIKTIGVYGMGKICELFYEEVKDTDIKISYFADVRAEQYGSGFGDIELVKPEDISGLEAVDVIVITPTYYVEEIKNKLEDCGVTSQMLSIDEIIYEL